MVWFFALLLLLAGLVLGVLGLARRPDGSRAREHLGVLLARGEISVDEHRERASTIGAGGDPTRTVLLALAAALVALGLLGGGIAAATMGWGPMGGMMGGGMMDDGMMDGMMGGGMMGGGDTERVGPSPDPDAPEIEVVATDFAFEPDRIRLQAGETVNVVLSNDGNAHHTFTADGLDLDLRAQAGDTVSGALHATEPGTYTVVCTVPGHAEAGMRGTIEVSE